jgi:hypothetical protein
VSDSQSVETKKLAWIAAENAAWDAHRELRRLQDEAAKMKLAYLEAREKERENSELRTKER